MIIVCRTNWIVTDAAVPPAAGCALPAVLPRPATLLSRRGTMLSPHRRESRGPVAETGVPTR